MTVFKSCIKILKRNTGLFMLYIGIFFAMTAVMAKSLPDEESDEFRIKSVKVGIIDLDHSELSRGIKNYLEQTNKVCRIKNEKTEIQNRLFNRDIEYIVKIPENFQKNFEHEKMTLSVIKVPDSISGFYIDQKIDDFLNEVKVYLSADYTVADALQAVYDLPEEEKYINMLSTDEESLKVVHGFFQLAPFAMLNVICFGLGNVYAAFSREDIKKRTAASSLSNTRKNAEILLASFFIGAAVFVLILFLGFIMIRDGLTGNHLSGYYMVNLFCCMLVSLALSYMISVLGKNAEVRSGLINSVTLGMSFLCGVFIPLDMIHKNVKKAAQFFPLYWYEKCNELLKGTEILSDKLRYQVIQSMVIQILFAMAMLTVAVTLSNKKRRYI